MSGELQTEELKAIEVMDLDRAVCFMVSDIQSAVDAVRYEAADYSEQDRAAFYAGVRELLGELIKGEADATK